MNGPWSLTTPTVELTEVGNYNRTSSDDPASDRDINYPSRSYSSLGFRVTLYL